MAWAKLDDAFPDHPKVERLSDAAFRLYVRAICYSARLLTDGDVPYETLKRWAGKKRLLEELVEAGLFDMDGERWSVHDYLEYNRTRVQVLADRAAAADRMSKRRSPDVRPNIARSSPSQSDSDPLPDSTNPEIPTKRAPKPKRSRSEPPTVTDEFRARMVEKYAAIATPEEVNERIDESINHESAWKWASTELHVQRWLREDREFKQRLAPGGSRVAGGQPHGGAHRPYGVARNGAGPGEAFAREGARSGFETAPRGSIRADDGAPAPDSGAQP